MLAVRPARIVGDQRQLIDFFEDRVKFYFRDVRGFAYDEVNAAMAAGWSDLLDLEERLLRLQKSGPRRTSSRWPPVSNASRTSCTRPSSRAAHSTRPCWSPDPNAICLTRSIATAGQPIEDRIGALRPKVDLFFDKVLVNAPDPAVRANRLAHAA